MRNLKYDRFKWNFNELEAVPVSVRDALKAEETLHPFFNLYLSWEGSLRALLSSSGTL